MNILLATGVYFPSSGGSEISIRSLIENLSQKGHVVTVLTDKVSYHKTDADNNNQNLNIIRVTEDDLEAVFKNLCQQLNIDLVFSQLMWSERIICWSNELKIKNIYFIRSPGSDLDMSVGTAVSPTLIVANSQITSDFVASKWKRDSVILEPIINFTDYQCERQPDAELITMINPNEAKGGAVFQKISIKLPDRKFLAIRGWQHWKIAGSNNWDIKRLVSNSKAFGGNLIVPTEIDFTLNTNVTLEGPYDDMRVVYSRTRLLLVPSLWEEAFGRVAVEAMLNGIPVIASSRGALPEVISQGGTIVEDYLSISNWVEAIRLYDNEEFYKFKSTAAKHQAGKYQPANLIDAFENVMIKL